MDLMQTLKDVEDIGEDMEYEGMDTWAEYDEDTTEYEDEEEEEEKEEKTEIESEVIEADTLLDYMREFEARRTRELVSKTEEERQQLRHLIGVQEKKEEGASEETLITPEDKIEAIDEVSTESSIHPCLREIEISDSQLKLVNPYTVYPVPDDPGLLPAFWVLHERPPIYSPDGVQAFHDAVKRWGLRSISSFKNMLVTDEVNLRYYGIESRTMRAICEALTNNTFVQKVDLKDNKLSTDACRYLNDLLLKNNQIVSLSLSGCRIGAAGAEKLRDAISANKCLKMLDLSKCDLGNEGFEHIAIALIDNEDVEDVNLSHNQLDEPCSENLRDLLARSYTLKHLDLSWNSLYSAKTWKTLIHGFDKNNTLLSLNLSWNSLGTECLPNLCRLLSRSQSIEKLDFSSNRFIETDATAIAKALSKNRILQELYMGNNPIKAQGALVLVRAITPQLSPNRVLRILDLENVWANKDILQELETLETLKPWVTIKLGGILSNYQLLGPNVKRILFERANYEAMAPKQKRRQRNFGHFVMSLKDKMISQEKFMELVRKFKLKLSKSLINEIMNVFEGPKNTVDQGLLKSSYLKEYPGTTPAPAKPRKRIKATK